jgi:diphosphomevalonate decarboxylase
MVAYSEVVAGKAPGIEFRFGGMPAPVFEERVVKYINILKDYMPFLERFNLSIDSSNTFPHSAGIASSASAISSLALCFCSMEEVITGDGQENFFQRASFLSRLGSGSACRSVFGGFSAWGRSPGVKGLDDLHALPLRVENSFKEIHDAVLIVDSAKKTVSSSSGHGLMENHPYLEGRIMQARENMDRALEAIRQDDFGGFSSVVENEALSLHALMMSSSPGYLLLQGNTILVINKILKWRESSGVPCTFTIDAGPNVHLIYPGDARDDIVSFINESLIGYLEKGRWIDDKIGSGPEKIEQV